MKKFEKHLFLVGLLAGLTVAATMVNPYPASAASSSPVQVVPNIPFGNTVSGGSGLPSTIKVPSNRHLVIETLSVQVDVTPSGSNIEAYVTYKSGGNTVQMYVPLTFAYTTPSNDYDTYVATQNVRLYADPGSSVTLTTYSPTGSSGTDFLTVSGYKY